MGKRIGGLFNGTGAAVYLCIGFIPDWVKVWAVSDAELAHAYWNKNFRAAASVEGFMEHNGDQIVAKYASGAGIRPYHGGEFMTAAKQTSVTYGEGVFLARDDEEYRDKDLPTGGQTIDRWTLDTPGSRTGHFNGDVAGSYIGAGSKIKIDGRWYVIEALTAGQGEAADEVTLNVAVPSGIVQAIKGKYDYAPLPLNSVSKEGFVINATADINVNNELQAFEAGVYDL